MTVTFTPSKGAAEGRSGVFARASDLREVIHRLRDSLGDIRDILLADRQGLALVSTFTDSEQESRLAAFACILAEDSRRAIHDMDLGETSHVIVTGGKGYVYLREMSEDLLMALTVRPGVDWASLIPRIDWAVLELARVGRGA